MTKTLTAICALTCLTLTAPRALAVDPPGWVGPTTITQITVQPNGRLYVYIDAATPDLGCTGNSDGSLEFDTSAPFFKEQYALLLAAHTAGRQVRIYVSGCGYFPYAQNSHYF